MTPPANFLNFLFQNETQSSGNDSGAFADVAGGPSSTALLLPANGSSYNANRNPHVLVTQMALLLYLGEYTHAQHLWSRSQEGGGAANAANNNDYAQLEQLWNAAIYMCLWNTGGMHNDLMASSNRHIYSAIATNASDTGIASMQIENKEDELLSSGERKYNLDDDGAVGTSTSSATTTTPLPFSTLALRELQSCQTSQLEPLSTYAAELKGVFRSRINKRLHKYVAKLDITEFRLRMNFSDCEAGEEQEEEEDWIAYGWKKDRGRYLVSDDNGGVVFGDYDVNDNEEYNGMSKHAHDVDGIEKLTNIVMFLEEKLNA